MAANLLGNANLWFILAEANGLSGTATLKAGQTITVPNSVESGKLDADTHKVYNESEIIGSTMPNVRQKAKSRRCKNFFAIVIMVVVAVVAAALTAGASMLIMSAALAATSGVVMTTVAVAAAVIASAAVGAAIYAGMNIVQQGILIAADIQDGFDWSQVGKQAISGAESGAFAAATAGAGMLSGVAQTLAKVAIQATRIYVNRSSYTDKHGHINNWSGMTLQMLSVFGDGSEAANQAGKAADNANKAMAAVNWINQNANYISPWLNLAETSINHNGQLTDADWVNAIGQTFNAVVGDNVQGTRYTDVIKRSALETVGAVALSSIDKEAAYSYFENSVAREIGEYAGGKIKQVLKTDTWGQDAMKRVQQKRAISRMSFIDVNDREIVSSEQGAIFDSVIDSESKLSDKEIATDNFKALLAHRDNLDQVGRDILNDDEFFAHVVQDIRENGYDSPYAQISGLVLKTDDTELLASIVADNRKRFAETIIDQGNFVGAIAVKGMEQLGYSDLPDISHDKIDRVDNATIQYFANPEGAEGVSLNTWQTLRATGFIDEKTYQTIGYSAFESEAARAELIATIATLGFSAVRNPKGVIDGAKSLWNGGKAAAKLSAEGLQYGVRQLRVLGNLAKGKLSTVFPKGKNVNSTLEMLESKIAGRPREIGYIVDSKSGEVLATTRAPISNPRKLRFDEEQLRSLEGNIMTHNHPSGATFSIQDISTGLGSGAEEIRAVTEEGIHVIKFADNAPKYAGNQMGAIGYMSKQQEIAISELKSEFQSGVRQLPVGASKAEMEVFNAKIILDKVLQNNEWIQYSFIKN
ncbi:hypothetical Protein YC6258_02152 [Gynuella sunshinyii YC6258]|uniref:LysM domain-containing protein n=1 Tax=Gynuella sunshinyii YC6258 TaxID=1445510 RepID=A0A0C5V3Y7_9GAMM|nr:hypothetical Protein YC6258_02152 [Gynuella sunshinyii YC6258]